jgi:hypothetical protein
MLSMLLFGCRKDASFSTIPSITLKSATKVKYNGLDSIIFMIDYKDGDGDIGLSQSDTTYPYEYGGKYYNNIIIDYYEKDGNTFRRVKPPFTNIDTVQFSYRIPVLNNTKKSRPILGSVRVGVQLVLVPQYSNICMFKIRLYDKALNVSNTVESQAISR